MYLHLTALQIYLLKEQKNEEEIDKIAIEVYNKYSKFISMFGDDKNSKEALLKLKRELLKTAKMIKTEKFNQNTKNKFISYGEKMSTIVLHSILMQNGISSIPVISKFVTPLSADTIIIIFSFLFNSPIIFGKLTMSSLSFNIDPPTFITIILPELFVYIFINIGLGKYIIF